MGVEGAPNPGSQSLSIGYIYNWRVRTETVEDVHGLSAPYLSQPLCVCCGWVNRRATVH